jgi:hypothetical protein
MGTIRKTIELDDEDVMHILNCLAKTRKYWEAGEDFYPFVLQSIVNKYKKQLTISELELTEEMLFQDEDKEVFVSGEE